jgi:DNA-binding IscR family transcriptional regulator
MKILKGLAKRNIIGSTKGPHGGFFAEKNTAIFSIIFIIYVIDVLASFSRCQLGLDECSSDNPCPIHFDILPFKNNIFNVLQEKLIGDVVKDIEVGNSFFVTVINGM